jgi:phosphate/sulfate permease
MESFLLFGVILLAILAIADLVVGVSNDAVNFLNSAVGSGVASFRTVMIVASAGIFIGALSSAGMMEIAREGIFNPEYFSLQDVIMIFLAVMITDIFLLDAFNTLGLPTSTTVSIVFELLGASVIIAMIKVLHNNYPMNWLFNINDAETGLKGFLNWTKTNTIISGIFLSILFAFIAGTFIMFFSRLIFSFNYQRKLKYVGVIWASLAMLALSYFMVYKGLKATYSVEKMSYSRLIEFNNKINNTTDTLLSDSEVIIVKIAEGNQLEFQKSKEKSKSGEVMYVALFGNKKIKSTVEYIKAQMWWFVIFVFIFWVIIFSILRKAGYNPLKFVVLAGTFSLAMAFAGNDLVNFIGVPLAGWQSYTLYSAVLPVGGHRILPTEYMMSGLKFPIQTPYLYLMGAGMIMIMTLWFSKKAKTVTETSVKLSAQEETDEKFSSNLLSRWIVRGSLNLSNLLVSIVPDYFIRSINKQFVPAIVDNDVDYPAFDLVRASVNLTVSSMLIALGTSLKLPLSTTYVTFMVAMGASLADRAWGRESAVYRIAGVLNVIGGWFLTAFAAFVTAGIIAAILYKFELAGLIFLLLALGSFIAVTEYNHRQSLYKKSKAVQSAQTIDLTTDKAMQKTGLKLSESLQKISEAYYNAIEGLLSEDTAKIDKAKKTCVELNNFYSDIKNNLFKSIKKSKLSEKKTAQLYILSNDMMQDILQSLTFITDTSAAHVRNVHKPLSPSQIETIRKIQIELISYIRSIADALSANQYDELSEIKTLKRSIFDHIEDALSYQVEGINKKEYGFKNTDIVLNILLETKDLVAISVRFSKLLQRLYKGQSPLGNK